MKGWTVEELEAMRLADAEIEQTFIAPSRDERAMSAALDRLAKIDCLAEHDDTKRAKDAARSRAYYYAHREERLAYKRAWRQMHKAERAAYDREWQKAHREERRVYWQAYRQAHKAMTQNKTEDHNG